MKRFLFIIIMIVSVLTLICCSNSSTPEKIASQVAELRGLDQPEDIKFEFLSSNEFRDRLITVFERGYSPEEAVIEQEIYEMMGIMGEDQNLYDSMIEVYSEQVIGFYDDELDMMYIKKKGGSWGTIEKMTFAHEYTHVLQDYHFGLTKMKNEAKGNTDRTLALQAFVEGDAMNTMIEYAKQYIDRDDLIALANEPDPYETEKLMEAPPIIREPMRFSYEAGLEFVQYSKHASPDEYFTSPPSSTEQILHYLYKFTEEYQTMYIPDLSNILGESWILVRSDTLGEFMIKLWLSHLVPTHTAENGSNGWNGDLLEYWKDNKGNKLIVVSSSWDNSANVFWVIFEEYVKKWIETCGGEHLWMHEWNPDERLWQIGNITVYSKQYGKNVLILISNDEMTLKRSLYAFDSTPRAIDSYLNSEFPSDMHTIHVSADATGDSTGESWDDAYTSLHQAISVARHGDQIWVASGTYTPTGVDEDNKNFQMKEGVAIFGGFPNKGNPSWKDRDLEFNPTTLCGYIEADAGWYSQYPVVYSEDLNDTAILDGFTIRAGQRYGMINVDSSPTVRNCTFTMNEGAIRNEYSTPVVIDCVFIDNSAGMNNDNSSPIVLNCVFEENHGSGISSNDSSPKVINCVFLDNESLRGGGMYNTDSSPVIANCVFANNTARSGGAIFNSYSDTRIINCTVVGNTAWGNRAASGIENFADCTLHVTNSIIWANDSCQVGVVGMRPCEPIPNAIFHSNVDGDYGKPEDGNISVAPLFVDPVNRDFRLLPNSPCIDAGDNDIIPFWLNTDSEGNVRIVNGDDDRATSVDLGAFEYIP